MLIQLLKLSQDSDHVLHILVSYPVNDGFNSFLPLFLFRLLLALLTIFNKPKTWTDFHLIISINISFY